MTKGSISVGQTCDRDGNVTSESRSFPNVTGNPGNGTQTFSYDALNRVTGSSGLAAARSYLAFLLEACDAVRHRPNQDRHRPTTIGHLDRLAGSHPSQDGAGITPQLPNTNPFHVRHRRTWSRRFSGSR
jgi:hypothetical protein